MAFDFSVEVAQNVVYALNGSSFQDISDLWANTTIYEWMDDSLNLMAQKYGLFNERVIGADNAQLQVANPQADYLLPADHLATVHVELNNTVLRAATVREMESYDQDWDATLCGPNVIPGKFVGDYLGVGYIRVYPIPSQPGTLGLVYQQTPPTLTPASPTIPFMIGPIADVLALRAIREARAIETDAQMPEVVQFCDGLTQVYIGVLEAYWGGGM